MSKGIRNIGSLLPATSDYRALRTSWKSDVVAGITVGIVALPLALAFGVSSGVGAEAGLITAIIAGIIAAVFGGSNVQVSGPTGAMVVVLAPIVATHGAGSVLVVGILAGTILVVAGVLRLGRTVSYIPWPVIEGFTVGIGVIIFLQQVPSAVGVSGEGHHTNSVIAAIQSMTEADPRKALYSVMVVIAVAVIMLVLSRLNGWIPASFLAIVAVSVVAALFRLPLETIGELPHSLPAPHLPELSLTLVYALIGPAFAVAALAAIESLLSARVAGSMADTGPFNADRELVGQGLASLASGVFGGMPATGAIARTAVNVRSGAKTRVSAIVHSLSLLAVVYLAATVVSHIPLAALAGVLMVTAGKMVSVATIKEVTRTSRPDAAVFILTIIVTVTFDLVIAVGIGIAAAAFFALRALSRASGIHRQELRGEPQPGDERIALFRLEGSLFFGAAEGILERIERYEGVEVVILRLSQLQLVDATGARTLTELVDVLERKGITVLIKGIRKEHLRIFQRVGVVNSLRHANHLFDELAPAVEHARSHVRRSAAGAMY